MAGLIAYGRRGDFSRDQSVALLAHRRAGGAFSRSGHRHMNLTFLGAARTVTGSKHLLDTGSAKVLVDGGLFQGLKELRERNWQAVSGQAVGASTRSCSRTRISITAAICRGWSPHGFRGRVFCTAGTQDLCRIVLPDSGRLQEEDAENANRHNYSKHAPALPLYTETDAHRRDHPAAAGRLRSADAGRRRHRGRLHQRRASARLRVRADPRQRQDHPFRRRSRPLRSAGAARSDDGRRGRLPARRVDVRQPHPRARRRRRAAGAGRQGDVRARRPHHHSRVRDRPRRRVDLLDQAAGRAEADPGHAGLRRQPDGG